MKKIINFSFFFSMFFQGIVLSFEPFEFYLYYIVVLILLPYLIYKYSIPNFFYALMSLFFFIGCFHVLNGNNDWFSFIKVYGGILFTYTFFYYVLPVNNWNPVIIFDKYIKAAYLIALIGLFQIFSFIIGFVPGANFSWIFNKWSYSLTDGGFLRLNSVLMEPSSYSMIIAPAVFIAIYNIFFRKNLFVNKIKSYILLLSYILTQSGNFLTGITIIFLLISLNNSTIGRFLIINLIGALSLYTSYLYIPDIRIRVDSSLLIFKADLVDKEFIIENKIHGSTYVLYTNIQAALKNFEAHPFTGTGIGSHPSAYDKYKMDAIFEENGNSKDGNSLLVRLVSETGLLGVSFLIGFIFLFFIKNNYNTDDSYWLISNATIVVILLYCQRQGNYFINGFPFFIWLYYGTKKHLIDNYGTKTNLF